MSVYALEAPSTINFEGPLTIDATAGGIGLTASKYNGVVGVSQPATRAVVTVETAPCRYSCVPSGVVAISATVGHLLNPGDVLIIESAQNIAQFRAIRTTGTSATLQVSYQSG